MTNTEASSLFLEAGGEFFTLVEYLDPAEIEELLECARTVKELRNLAIHRREHETV